MKIHGTSEQSAKPRPRSVHRLEADLRSTASPLAVPEGFTERVVAAIRVVAAESSDRSRPVFVWRRSVWAGGGVCAALALALLGWTRIQEGHRAATDVRQAMSATVAASEQLAEWSAGVPLLVVEPMQQEVNNLVDDMRRATRILLADLD